MKFIEQVLEGEVLEIFNLDLCGSFGTISRVISNSSQFASSLAGWYWFTSAVDWGLRLH
jgi:hypothetical protein